MADQGFDWDDLRYVLAIARGSSLAGAAGALGVNPSSVHRRLAALEKRLGVRLFERSRDGYHPTRQGQTLIDSALRMEAEALGAQRRVQGTELALSGLVRVSTSELLGLYLLPPLLSRFASDYPEVEVEISIDNRLVDLARREADVAVRATEQPPAHLVGRRIAKIASAAYAHRNYLDRAGRGQPLDAYEWLALDQSLARVPQARWLRERVPHARSRFRFNMIEAVHQGLREGLGAAVMPCFVCDREPDLERMTDPETFGEYGVWVLVHPDLRRSARIRAFMRAIGAAIGAHEQNLMGIRAT